MLYNVWTDSCDEWTSGIEPSCPASAHDRHRLLLPHAAAWIRGPEIAPRLASSCSAVLLPRGVTAQVETIDTDFGGADLIELPDEIWASVQQAMKQTTATATTGRWRWDWIHVPAASYCTLRRLSRLTTPPTEHLASWICDQLRRAIAEWRRVDQRATRSPRHVLPAHHLVAHQSARRIAQRWREGISLQELASRAEMSVFHLLRSFRACHGLTPHQFLLQIRLRRSLHLLDGGQLSGAELARETGFCSHGHFCVAFRAAFGCTPSDYLGGGKRAKNPAVARRLWRAGTDLPRHRTATSLRLPG